MSPGQARPRRRPRVSYARGPRADRQGAGGGRARGVIGIAAGVVLGGCSSNATRQASPRWKNTRSIAKSWLPTCTGYSEPTKPQVAAELGDEAAEVPNEGAVEVALGVAVGEREELEAVGVLELVEGVGVDSYERGGCSLRGGCATQSRARLDLPLELALGPALLDRSEDVEFARFSRLRLAEDDEVMGPGQLCHQR